MQNNTDFIEKTTLGFPPACLLLSVLHLPNPATFESVGQYLVNLTKVPIDSGKPGD